MGKKCWFHDWEVVERIGDSTLKSKVQSEINGDSFHLEYVGDYPYYIKKVCMKCEVIEDTITPEIERIKASYYNNIEREKKAQKIINKEL